MKLSKFRAYLNEYWDEIDNRAIANKDSNSAVTELIFLYEQFDLNDRNMADGIIIEWINSNNQRKLFDALALVDHFQISAALPTLQKLVDQLQRHVDHETPYTLAKIKRIMDRLDYTLHQPSS